MKRFQNGKMVVLFMGLSCLPLGVASCGNNASGNANNSALAQNAVKVSKGMNETQVRALLGEPTNIISDSLAPSPNASISINAWTYDGPPKINVGFMSGLVNAFTVDGKQIVGP